jgi:arginyl-tRNA synthetase
LVNTLREFKQESEKLLGRALKQSFPEWAGETLRLVVPSNFTFGELSSSVSHEIAREKRLSPDEVARKISATMKPEPSSLISAVEDVSGYINFRLNYDLAANRIIETALSEDLAYGAEKVSAPIRVTVEHTSANPSGPLTMAHARNSILGDSLARLLKARGNLVNRRFYVDDVGRQVSILAYGFRLLDRPKPQGKADHWFGRLYACINCALQIATTKRKLELLDSGDTEQRLQLQRDLDEWVGIAAELENTDKELLSNVLSAVQADPDPEKSVQEIGRKYEEKDKETVELVREVSNQCLDGIRRTLEEIDILFDTWDWESQLIWDGDVTKVLSSLTKLPFTKVDGISVSLDINAIADAYSLRSKLNISESYEVPSLTLIRSDGTTLYPTRDIAYTMVKFHDSDRVINVIASEQSLPQLQIRVALYAMGERKASDNLVHYAYGLVELPGMKMSKRRARYVAVDEVIDQARKRVREQMGGRKHEIGQDESETIVDAIALGAIKFAMLNVNSAKNLTFTWDRVLSLEKNSAPFINYAYTRAGSILRKLGILPERADLNRLSHPLEHLLVFKIAQFPDVFVEAADQLKPEEIANHANSLAEKFHEYYEKVDVIHADEQVKNARALLVKAVQITLRNSMELLGIKLTERM